MWGPLGRPFLDVGTPERVTFVAGGIGQTPFLAYARELLGTRGFGGDTPRKRTGKVSLYYGVRTASLAASNSVGVGPFAPRSAIWPSNASRT